MPEDDYAKKILNYMRLDMSLDKCDVIIGLGALDTRIAERSAQLILDGYGDLLVFSGGFGKVTKGKNKKTEAETSKDIAIKMGVDESKIVLEDKASNTGENIQFTEKLLLVKGIQPKSVLLVTKPYMERRVFATFKKQWSDEDTRILLTSPQITYEEHFNSKIPKKLFLNLMVGDLQRIKEFPKQGFQIKQDIPYDVWNAYEQLIKMGYDEQLLEGVS